MVIEYKKENIGIFGKVKLYEVDAINLQEARELIKQGKCKESDWIKNIVPTSGLNAIARRLANAQIKANEGIITYGAVGTGASIPTLGDTLLETEVYRVLCVLTVETTILTIESYINKSSANGYTLKEYGLFGEEATASANTGTLFERVNINKAKNNTFGLYILSEITLK